jgi:AcrR family transcriptional regulator
LASYAEIGVVRFATYLQAAADEIKKVRSGPKSRLKMLASGARLLDDIDHRDLLVEQVSADAGVAKGTFYIYFKSKDAFLREMATLYIDFELQAYPRLSSRDSAFVNTRKWIAWYEKTFAANVGVLRCMVQMGAGDPAMREIWHARNRRLVDRSMRGWERQNPSKDPVMMRLAVRTAGAMLDQSLFERHNVLPGPGREEPQDLDLIIDLHALLNFRALYGENPPVDDFPADSPLRALLPGPSRVDL